MNNKKIKDITRYQYIDSIRGWAVLGVMLCHIRLHLNYSPIIIMEILNAGNYGVQLFFIGSALTLYMSCNSRFGRDKYPILYFWIRRIFRIGPLFWGAIIFYQFYDSRAGHLFLAEGVKVWHVISTFFFLHGFHPESINKVVEGGWSIAIEMGFYIIVPICFKYIKNIKDSIISTITFTLLSLLLCYILKTILDPVFLSQGISSYTIQIFNYYFFIRQMPVFFCGFIAYFLIKGDYLDKRKLGGSSISTILLYVSILLIISLSILQSFIKLDYLLFSISYILFIWGLSGNGTSLINNKIIAYIGKISFSGYLTHFVVIDLVVDNSFINLVINKFQSSVLEIFLLFITVLVITVLLSTITYYLIEKQGQFLGKKLISFIDSKLILNTKTI